MTPDEIEALATALEPRIKKFVEEEITRQVNSGILQRGGANHSLLTYQQAARALLPFKISVHSLRIYASEATPWRCRLRIVKLGHRTVGIRPVDLEKWKEANSK
jgi:hypothetical protein